MHSNAFINILKYEMNLISKRNFLKKRQIILKSSTKGWLFQSKTLYKNEDYFYKLLFDIHEINI